MRVLLLGATGRTGRRVLKRLEAKGHHVVTYGRRAGGGAVALTGAMDDVDALREAASGADMILSCLGSSNTEPVCSTATRTVIEADCKIERYIIVSGASIELPGDTRGPAERVVGKALRLFFGKMLDDRRAEIALLENSHLAWIALRPPRLTDKPGKGKYRFDFERPHVLHITRDDLADAVVETLDRDDLVGRAPFVSEG
ncbi:MAG: NAD(P)-binding oxidoreductase [Pseudomonadota bacterium]